MSALTKRKRPPGYQQLKTFIHSHKNDLNKINHFNHFFESYRMDVAFWSLSLKNIYSYKQLFNAWKHLYFEIWIEEFHDCSSDHVLSITDIQMNKSLWKLIHYDYLSLCNSNKKYEKERKLRDQQNLKTYASSSSSSNNNHSSKDISLPIPELSIQKEQRQQQIQQPYKKVAQEKKKLQKNQQEQKVEEKAHQVQQLQQEPCEITRSSPPIMENNSNLLKQFITNMSVTSMILIILIINILIILWFFLGHY